MVDRERVIGDLEEQIAWIRDNDFHKFPGWGHAVLAMRDALALLKAQEPKTGHWVDQCCRDFLCSECGHKLVNNNWVRSDGYCHDDLPKYCPECGVKMERGIIQRRFVGEDKIVYPDYNKKTLDRR